MFQRFLFLLLSLALIWSPAFALTPTEAMDQLITDSAILHNVIHGAANSDVTTEGGDVPTLAKALAKLSGFNPTGDYAHSTSYNVLDLTVDASDEGGNGAGTVYIALSTFTSGDGTAGQQLSDEIAAGKWMVHQGLTSVDFSSSLMLRVANYAAAQALTGLSDGQLVIVGDRTAVGSGAGGVFMFKSGNWTAEVSADTQKGIFLPLSSDTDGSEGCLVRQYAPRVLDTSWFEIAGDGSTNDTAAMNAYMSVVKITSKVAYFPEGTFLVNSETTDGYCLEFPDGVEIRGAGKGRTIFKRDPAGTANADIARVENDASAAVDTIVANYVKVSGITFDGSDKVQRDFYPRSVGNLLIEDCEFKNTKRAGGGGHGLRALWCDNVKVVRSEGYECSDNGLSIEISDHAVMDQCGAYNNNQMGLSLNAVVDGTIVNSWAHDNVQSGITAESGGIGADDRSRKLSLVNNRSYDNGESGLIAGTAGTKELIIVGNTLVDNGYYGLISTSLDATHKTEDVLINSNIILRNGRHGISLISSSGTSFADKVVITGNDISDNGQETDDTYAGVKAENSNITSLIITGNRISHDGTGNVTKYGLDLGGPISAATVSGNELIGHATAPYTIGATVLTLGKNNLGAPSLDLTGAATPSVAVHYPVYTVGNTTPLTITNFTGGSVGQTIKLRCTSGANTTLQNNATLKLSGSIDYLMPFGAVISLTMYNSGVWTEESRSEL